MVNLLTLLLFINCIIIPGTWSAKRVTFAPNSNRVVKKDVGYEVLLDSIEKPIVLLVPGFSTTEILSFGLIKNAQKHECAQQALPIAEYRNDYFEELPNWLQEEGYDVRVAVLESSYENTPSILVNSNCFRNQVIQAAQESPTKSVIIIAHSMGGLVTRAYTQSAQFVQDRNNLKLPLIENIFLVGTPNQGLPLHFLFNFLFSCESPRTKQRAACEFTSYKWMRGFNQEFTNHPSNLGIYAVGGTHFNSFVGYLSGSFFCLISGPNDGAVPVNSAISIDHVDAKIIYLTSHQRSVGSPSYFSGIKGQPSPFFIECVYPVLLDGDGSQCNSTAIPTCRPAISVYVSFSFLFFILVITLARLIKKKLRSN